MISSEKLSVSKEAVERFLQIRDSGVTNMFARDVVCALAGLTKEEYYSIISNFDEYLNKYNLEVNSNWR
jgi:hypothetical protein